MCEVEGCDRPPGAYSSEYCHRCFERLVAEGQIDPEDHCDYYERKSNKASYPIDKYHDHFDDGKGDDEDDD